MKNATRFVIAAAALAIFASVGQLKAGADDSIAASPKVRSQLDEHYNRTHPAPPQATVLVATTTPDGKLAASPSVQARMHRGFTEITPAVQETTETAGYRPTGSDGITASPKARAMLGERQQTVELAPMR